MEQDITGSAHVHTHDAHAPTNDAHAQGRLSYKGAAASLGCRSRTNTRARGQVWVPGVLEFFGGKTFPCVVVMLWTVSAVVRKFSTSSVSNNSSWFFTLLALLLLLQLAMNGNSRETV